MKIRIEEIREEILSANSGYTCRFVLELVRALEEAKEIMVGTSEADALDRKDWIKKWFE